MQVQPKWTTYLWHVDSSVRAGVRPTLSSVAPDIGPVCFPEVVYSTKPWVPGSHVGGNGQLRREVVVTQSGPQEGLCEGPELRKEGPEDEPDTPVSGQGPLFRYHLLVPKLYHVLSEGWSPLGNLEW